MARQESLRAEVIGGDIADIIEVMLATGVRIGEVLALRRRDIDLGARTIEVNATIKT